MARSLAAQPADRGKDGNGNYIATFPGGTPESRAWAVAPVGKVVSITVLSVEQLNYQVRLSDVRRLAQGLVEDRDMAATPGAPN